MSSIQPFTGLDVATASLRHLIDQGLVRDFTMDVREDGVQIRLVPADAAVRTLKTAHYFKRHSNSD